MTMSDNRRCPVRETQRDKSRRGAHTKLTVAESHRAEQGHERESDMAYRVGMEPVVQTGPLLVHTHHLLHLLKTGIHGHQIKEGRPISVGDSWLFLGADDLRVKVDQPTGHRQAHLQAALRLQAAVLQEVVEGAQLMKVGDEPQLGAGILGRHVRGYKT
ncbi:hypothetical protein EYF80_007294 [Liparis tanakae]|uniref:Uncharacterized protein n=1 Tax=Liparis tanakae TaxID=230148 RepID=A0A4Z2IWU1_9TELE|nr:hypothetical protein EYF80_007294 [Liparis tanakae]